MDSKIKDKTILNFGRLLENLLSRDPNEKLILEDQAVEGLADYMDLMTKNQEDQTVESRLKQE